MVCFMLKYAKEFYLFGTFKRLFLFLFGLVCPLEVVSFSQLILGMDLELAEGYRDTLKNLKVLLGLICLLCFCGLFGHIGKAREILNLTLMWSCIVKV